MVMMTKETIKEWKRIGRAEKADYLIIYWNEIDGIERADYIHDPGNLDLSKAISAYGEHFLEIHNLTLDEQLKMRKVRRKIKLILEKFKSFNEEVFENICNILNLYDEEQKEWKIANNIERRLTAKKITGALKNAIDAHGPITKDLISSATKRLMSAWKQEE